MILVIILCQIPTNLGLLLSVYLSSLGHKVLFKVAEGIGVTQINLQGRFHIASIVIKHRFSCNRTDLWTIIIDLSYFPNFLVFDLCNFRGRTYFLLEIMVLDWCTYFVD